MLNSLVIFNKLYIIPEESMTHSLKTVLIYYNTIFCFNFSHKFIILVQLNPYHQNALDDLLVTMNQTLLKRKTN